MLNVVELEREWKRYRAKKRLPYIIASIAVSLLVVVVLIYTLTNTTTDRKPNQVVTKSSDDSNINSEVASASSHSIKKIDKGAKEGSTFIIKPSMEFANSAITKKPLPLFVPGSKGVADNKEESKELPRSSATPEQKKQTATKSTQTILPSSPKPQVEDDRSLQTKEIQSDMVNKESSDKKKSQIRLTMKDEQKSLQEVINRFKRNKSPKLSLYIAKRYYAMGNYNKSYNYALITNQIDESIEDSWIIFAKSLYKLGEKKMAMKTLYSYIKNSESIKANMLLNEMKRGTFR